MSYTALYWMGGVVQWGRPALSPKGDNIFPLFNKPLDTVIASLIFTTPYGGNSLIAILLKNSCQWVTFITRHSFSLVTSGFPLLWYLSVSIPTDYWDRWAAYQPHAPCLPFLHAVEAPRSTLFPRSPRHGSEVVSAMPCFCHLQKHVLFWGVVQTVSHFTSNRRWVSIWDRLKF